MTTENILAPVASLTLPDPAGLTNRAQQALAFIDTFQIDSADAYGLAADELKSIKARATALEEQRTGITGPLNKVLKAVNSLFGGPADLLERAERMLKTKMLAYDQEQQRIAAETRRKAEEVAAAERRRLEAEAAERQRLAAEEQRKSDVARAAGDEQAARIAASNAQRASAEAQAAALTSQMVVAPLTEVARPKASGISTSKKLDFAVEDISKLIAYVVTGDGNAHIAHPELLALLGVGDSVRIRAYVKGVGLACALPGIRVVEERVMSARSA